MARQTAALALAGTLGIALAVASSRSLDPDLLEARAGRPVGSAEEAAIRATVVEFQRIYQDFFASGGMPALIDVFPASRELKHQVFKDVGFVRDAGLVSVQDLATVTVVAVRSRPGGLAEADVYEEWNHVLQAGADRRPASHLKGLGQGFRYLLRPTGRGWIVVGWDLLDLARPDVEVQAW